MYNISYSHFDLLQYYKYMGVGGSVGWSAETPKYYLIYKQPLRQIYISHWYSSLQATVISRLYQLFISGSIATK